MLCDGPYNPGMSCHADATDTRPSAIFLMGPTATGKTALACALATRFPVELVSVDSALVYRGLDVGAAKPDAETLRRHPHALIDIRDPSEPYSAAMFREDALAAMQAITARGHAPLLVGGTGLYFRALERGLSAMPPADAGCANACARKPNAKAGRRCTRASRNSIPRLPRGSVPMTPSASSVRWKRSSFRATRSPRCTRVCGTPGACRTGY